MLVLVSCVYDPAFYYTTEELGTAMDVQHIVEEPEVHILARSKSSLQDQTMFTQCRIDCLRNLCATLFTRTGVPINDVMRFFHGDGPAQQFEAGQHIGGDYFCVGCTVKSCRADDLAYTFRSQHLTITEHQAFVLQGKSWEKGGVNPLDNLKAQELHDEITARGRDAGHCTKPQLQKIFNEMRNGIANVPALLQVKPREELKNLNLQHYEILSTEPMHDLKGHLSNMIDECLHIATNEVVAMLTKIRDTVLSKDTLRASDYRKAVILMYIQLEGLSCDPLLKQLFSTAVEICHICYSHDSVRTPRAILRLHNITFLHAYLCTKLFENPKTLTGRRMFGRYFHAISTHIAHLYRIVCLRSVNAEKQERLFGQSKQITKRTSNNQPKHIIQNIIERIQIERSQKQQLVDQEDSSIKTLGNSIGPMPNTIIPTQLMVSIPNHYQAHLERISDFLSKGEGIWWKKHALGIEFLDGSNQGDYHSLGPKLMHFRSCSLEDVDRYLHENWEMCIGQKIPLPALHIRTYGTDGEFEDVVTTDM